jgi:hypothetical protein
MQNQIKIKSNQIKLNQINMQALLRVQRVKTEQHLTQLSLRACNADRHSHGTDA